MYEGTLETGGVEEKVKYRYKNYFVENVNLLWPQDRRTEAFRNHFRDQPPEVMETFEATATISDARIEQPGQTFPRSPSVTVRRRVNSDGKRTRWACQYPFSNHSLDMDFLRQGESITEDTDSHSIRIKPMLRLETVASAATNAQLSREDSMDLS